jgi:hypothetical protein
MLCLKAPHHKSTLEINRGARGRLIPAGVCVIDVFCNHFSKDYFGDGVAAGDRRKTMIKELAASYRNDCGLISPHDSFWNIGTLGVCRSSIKLRSTFCTARAYRSSYVVLQRFYF